MHIRRFSDGIPYEAAGHENMACFQIQGRDAGPMANFWMGVSLIDPGGRIHPSASPAEKAYVVLSGEVTISNGQQSAVLRQWDSCRIAPNELRAVENNGNTPAALLLTMATAG